MTEHRAVRSAIDGDDGDATRRRRSERGPDGRGIFRTDHQGIDGGVQQVRDVGQLALR
jgi:hypothetical protein